MSGAHANNLQTFDATVETAVNGATSAIGTMEGTMAANFTTLGTQLGTSPYANGVLHLTSTYMDDTAGARLTMTVNSTNYSYSTIAPLTTAQVFNVVSSTSGNDGTAAGSPAGCTAVNILGVDGSYNLVGETVLTNGTANVATANSYISVLSMTPSAGLQASGTQIYCGPSSGSTGHYHCEMEPWRLTNCAFTCPNGYRALATTLHFSSDTAGSQLQFLVTNPSSALFHCRYSTANVNRWDNNNVTGIFALEAQETLWVNNSSSSPTNKFVAIS